LAGGLEKTIQQWQRDKLGIVALTLMVENPDGERATIAGARTWREQHGLRSAYVAADPRTSMGTGGMFSTPLFTIVDPRSMRVVARPAGWGGRHPDELIALARKNRR
jgi:hypothetical protein